MVDEPAAATRTVRVASDGRGFGHVIVNGHDISHGVQGVTVRVEPGRVPQVEVDLSILDVDSEIEGEVLIPDRTREALIALGWRAPDAMPSTAAAYDREVLVAVLVYHYRRGIEGCGCGWAELGLSHPEHVADVYEASVATRSPRS